MHPEPWPNSLAFSIAFHFITSFCSKTHSNSQLIIHPPPALHKIDNHSNTFEALKLTVAYLWQTLTNLSFHTILVKVKGIENLNSQLECSQVKISMSFNFQHSYHLLFLHFLSNIIHDDSTKIFCQKSLSS